MIPVLGPLAADLCLAIGAGLILIADLVLPPGDKRVLGFGTLAVLVATLAATVWFDLTGPAVGGAYVGDGLSVFLKQLFLASAALAVLASIAHGSASFPRRQGEYYLLLLCSLLGMTLLAGVRDVVLLVVCFELMGIPLYVLAAWQKDDARAVEGALKLYLVGALSSVTILFGLSMLFGLAGTTSIDGIAAAALNRPSTGLMLGGAVALAGMGFKLGVFPFHMWVPDTYEGASTPFVAFLSIAPKAAGLAALLQLLYAGGQALLATMGIVVVALATVTLVMGNLLALNQENIKRMLAYSGVGHMGLLLMAVACGTDQGLAMLLFYLMAYLFSNAGTFLVVHAVQRAGGDDSVASYDGLVERSGWLATAMLLFLLSLAGIPFVVGFWAKLLVFLAAWNAGLSWLVVLGALLSVLALFYYLRVARAMFMNPAADAAPIQTDPGTQVAIAICLTFVVGMGLVPWPFVALVEAAAASFLGGQI